MLNIIPWSKLKSRMLYLGIYVLTQNGNSGDKVQKLWENNLFFFLLLAGKLLNANITVPLL